MFGLGVLWVSVRIYKRVKDVNFCFLSYKPTKESTYKPTKESAYKPTKESTYKPTK